MRIQDFLPWNRRLGYKRLPKDIEDDNPKPSKPHLSHAKDLLLSNTPVIVSHRFSRPKNSKSKPKLILRFSCVKDKRTVTRVIDVDLDPKKQSVPFLWGSYHGFLLFKNFLRKPTLFLWNPINRENYVVTVPKENVAVFAFFFHPKSKEYRVLCGNPNSAGGVLFDFYIFHLNTKSTRWISTFSHPPNLLANPLYLNGNLHWMVSDGIFWRANKYTFADCSNSIIAFNMDTEKFRTMAHPGGKCGFHGRHHNVHLMEKEGHLWWCDTSMELYIDVWILKDYDKLEWVLTHTVLTTPIDNFICRFRMSRLGTYKCEALDIFGDEFLVCMRRKVLLLYNLKLDTFRVLRWKNFSGRLISQRHVNSQCSLHRVIQ